MATFTTEELVSQYLERLAELARYGSEMHAVLDSLVRDSGVRAQGVVWRVKDPNSLREKIAKKGKYKSLSEITDLIGIRAIVHFADDIPRVCRVIEQNFLVDQAHSIDKTLMDVDAFGYRSIHYVARGRLNSVGPYPIEIQVRTALEHAWAEVTHAYQYKSSAAVPREMQRRLYRVAALLEVADAEFVEVRNEMSLFQWPENARGDQIEGKGLDRRAMKEYLATSKAALQLDTEIAAVTGAALHYVSDSAEQNLSQLRQLGIETTSELESVLSAKRSEILAFYMASDKVWIDYLAEHPESRRSASLPRGVSITYLGLMSGVTAGG